MTTQELANIKNMTKVELIFAMKKQARIIAAEFAENDNFTSSYIEGLQTEYRIMKKALEQL